LFVGGAVELCEWYGGMISTVSKTDKPIGFSDVATADLDPRRHRVFYWNVGKRLLDLVGGMALAVVASPVVIMVFVGLMLNRGRPFFSHERVGLGGRKFRCYKLRSMVLDADQKLSELLASDPAAAEEWRKFQKLENDPRITPIGRLLRRSSLDELPQLWNVLRGDMSLVGPRPVTEAELERYGSARRLYLSVRPGLTGPWQVSNRNSGTSTSYASRVEKDVAYVQGISFGRDLKLLFDTAFCMLRMSGR